MTALQTLLNTRDFGRLQQIASVFVRHGLGDMVHRLGWADALAKAGHVLHIDHADDLARLSSAEQLRRAFEELGPAFVKLGQMLAGRADLLAPDWIAQLEQLHSRAPPVPIDALREQLTQDLGAPPEQVFASWDDTPLAAASIA
jgi:ubiquinone biosynthesis protein